MDKVLYIVGVVDLFDNQEFIYQGPEYYSGIGELSYGMFTRYMCEAKIFNSKKVAKKFIKTRFLYPSSIKIFPINRKRLFQLKLVGI